MLPTRARPVHHPVVGDVAWGCVGRALQANGWSVQIVLGGAERHESRFVGGFLNSTGSGSDDNAPTLGARHQVRLPGLCT